MSKNLDLKSVKSQFKWLAGNAQRYAAVAVFLLFTAAYGFVLIQINTLSNPEVDESEVIAEVKTLPTPSVDEEAADKLQSLKDNSVNVQSLFQQGRTSPFQ